MNDNFTIEDVETLLGQCYFMVNKSLVKHLGFEIALWISDITSKLRYFKDRNQLDDRGFFFNTQDNIEKSTGLSPYQQTQIIKKLKELDIIEVEKRGMPPKNYYRFNYKILIQWLAKDQSTIDQEITPMMTEKFGHYNNKNKDNDNKDNKCSSSMNITASEKTPAAVNVVPPQDSSETNLTPDVKKIINYWKLLGLKLPGPRTKSYIRCVDSVRGLLDGTKLGFVYTVPQIIESIDNFKLSLRHDYVPVDKIYLKSLNLDQFIYNTFNVQTDKPSMFQHCLTNVPLPISPKPIDTPDPDPNITNYFKNFYQQEILGNTNIEFSKSDETYFRQATTMLLDFYNKHKDRYITPWWGPGDLAKVFVKVIMEYLKDRFDSDTSKFETWWFKRSDFFNKRLPAYMHAQALLKEIPEIRPLSM